MKLVETTGQTRPEVEAMLDAITGTMKECLDSEDATFVMPGLFKVTKKYVPAKPAQKDVPNPFKPGETRDVPAKPESWKIKVTPLKGLKDMA